MLITWHSNKYIKLMNAQIRLSKEANSEFIQYVQLTCHASPTRSEAVVDSFYRLDKPSVEQFHPLWSSARDLQKSHT